jgi:hypothetical protein
MEYETIGAARGRSQRRMHGKGNQNEKSQGSLPVDYQPGDSRSDSQNRELHVPVCISVHTTSSINSSSSSLRAIVRKRDSANCERNCQQLRGRVMRPWRRLRPSSFSWRIEQPSKSRTAVSPHTPSSPLTIPQLHHHLVSFRYTGNLRSSDPPAFSHTHALSSHDPTALRSPADSGSFWYVFCLQKFFRKLFTISIGYAKSASVVDRSKVGKGRNPFFRRLCLFFLRSVIVRSSKSL